MAILFSEVATHHARYDAMHDAGISKMELARKLGVDEKEVRRMLGAGHGILAPAHCQSG